MQNAKCKSQNEGLDTVAFSQIEILHFEIYNLHFSLAAAEAELRFHVNSFYGVRLPRLVVDIDDDRAEMHRTLWYFEPVRGLIEKSGDRLFLLHTDNRIRGPRHARIGNKSRPARKHPFVGCLDMGMGPDHSARLAVQMPREGDLL